MDELFIDNIRFISYNLYKRSILYYRRMKRLNNNKNII